MSLDNLSPFPNMNPVAVKASRDLTKIKKALKHKHMLEFIERFKWEGLPPELTQDLIERILFFRFKGAMFKYNDKHYFLPFALKGDIDSYGRYESIMPVLFTGQFKDGKTKDVGFLPEAATNVAFKVKYALGQEQDPYNAIILTDSSLEVSQDFMAPNDLIDPFIEQLTDILVLVNIDLVTSAKVFYIVARDANQKEAIENEFQNLDAQILSGKRAIVVTSELQLQELTGGAQAKDQARYFQTYQSFDNLRKDIIGLSNGGQFMKQEHTTQMETEVNTSSGSATLENGLRLRQEFCDLVNEYFGLSISVSANQSESDEEIAPEGAQTKDRRGEDAV